MGRIWVWLVAAGMVALVVLALGAGVQAASSKDLPERWRTWLDEQVYPLITREQRKAFLTLETDEQRTVFVQRLWDLWNAQSGMGSNFQRTWEERLEETASEFGNTTEDRARLWLLHGPPEVRKPIECDRVFHPLDIWVWAYLPGLGEKVTVIFFRPYGLGRYRLWDPNVDSRASLYTTEGNMALQQYLTTGDQRYQFGRPEYAVRPPTSSRRSGLPSSS